MKPKVRARNCCWGAFLLAAVLAPTLTGQTEKPQSGAQTAVAPPEDSYDAAADPSAIVTACKARFTVLTPQLIRMEWAADGKFEDRPSFVFLNRKLPAPKFKVGRMQSGRTSVLTLDTDKLRLRYRCAQDEDSRFTSENLGITLNLNGKEVAWHPGMADTGNLRGTTRTLDGARGDQNLEEPIGPGLVSRDGWTVVDDSTSPLFDSDRFDFAARDKSEWPWVVLRPDGERQDWYFFGYGHEYRHALEDFVGVAGRIPLPPRFALGAWWSRYWDYSDQELDELVRGFHENSVPLDVLVIDMGWHISKEQLAARHETDQSGEDLGWTGYTWNRTLFPDPDAFLQRVKQEGLKITMNVHPASGVEPWEQAYPAMATAMGIDPATRKYVPFDITDRKFAENFLRHVFHPLEQQGVDFWWLDWQQQSHTRLAGVNPTWWLNYVYFTDQEKEGKRPILFHRWGGLGNHRYQIGFSGDTISLWESLEFQPWFTATAANVGYAYWSHDIGGHMPGVDTPELYTRWIQFGAFSPILRTHVTKNPNAERRIWAYPEPYASIMRASYELRYALEPYLYTEARRTYDTGLAFLHPLYYDWPEEDAAYTTKGEYRFGEEMVVAPVTQPVEVDSGLARQQVWIPPGEWMEWPTGREFRGPAMVERNFSIDEVPVYLPAGTIVPMQPAMRYTGERRVDPLILLVVPLGDRQKSAYTVYEDGGKAEEYQRGVCAWTAVNAAQSDQELTVTISPVRGGYPGMISERSYEIRLPGDWPPESVTVNGTALALTRESGKPGWRYEGNTLSTVVSTRKYSVTEAVDIRVRRAAGSLAARPELDGFSGALTRLRAAYDALNSAWPPGRPPEELVEAFEAGDRLSYRPQTARQELGEFRGVYRGAVEEVRRLAGEMGAAEPAGSNDANRQRSERYRKALARAMAVLEDGQPR